MKPHVMQMLVTLSHGGAERLALTILHGVRGRVHGSICGLFGSGGPLVESIESFGLTHYSIDAGSKSKLRVWCELYQLFKRKCVDIIHIQAGYLLYFVYVPAMLAGVKIVYTEHAKHSLESQGMLRRVVRFLGPKLHAVTVVSSNLHRYFTEELRMNGEAVQVISNGVDATLFTPQGFSERGKSIPANRIVVGTVARFSEPKDHGNLLRAFRIVRERHDDVVLALVGDGETLPDVQSLIDEFALRGSVLLLGRQDRIPEFLRAMDLFVLPSKREGAPVSVLEAMACSIPVVATDVGGVHEILQDGHTGLIVPPQDHEALAGAMLRVLGDSALMRSFAERGPKEVAARFSQEIMNTKYMDMYSAVLRKDG